MSSMSSPSASSSSSSSSPSSSSSSSSSPSSSSSSSPSPSPLISPLSPDAEVSPLFTVLAVGDLNVRNRIIVGPTTRNRGVIPDEINADYYRLRARDTGFIISEGILIEAQGSEWSFAPGLFSDAQIEGWKKVTDAVHGEGGLIIAQLWHLGRLNHPKLQAGQPIFGPSAIAAKGGKFRQLEGTPGYQVPQAIRDPNHFISLFKSAAIAAKKAGFDGVELQGAGGYLCQQFLDPSSNLRTDKWGGSIENRCRFMLSAIDELISVWGSGRVGIRLQPAGGFNDMGFAKKDSIATYGFLLQELSKRKIAFVEMERYMEFLDPAQRGIKNFDTVRELKPYFNGVWIANGGYDGREGAQAIQEQVADAISISRPYMANPDLAYRIRYNLPINQVKWENVYGQQGGTKDQGYLDYPLAASARL